ncbi:MAG: nuclear transport factor 2 family protein [Rhodospirillales bacterium]|nr:nuclear transport factor 2 family protein [Rhodospirillales bacterium]
MTANWRRRFSGLLTLAASGSLAASAVASSLSEDRRILSELDVAYQAAVKANDADTMDRILHNDFVLVLGDGTVHTKADLLHSARTRHVTFEQQDEDPGTQVVRLYGDTAMVSARLWLKGRVDGKDFDFRVWFSDTYIRTPQGWRYAFAQAGARMPS